MRLLSREHLPLFAVLAAFALLRLLVIPAFGLGVDEAHYVLYGRFLDLSYFDHPPLVGWVQYVFTSLFGENLFGARIGAVIVGFLASLGIYALLCAVSSDRTAALVGVIALNASFLFNALFMMLMPDTLLFLLLVPVIFAVLAVEKENSVNHWLLLGGLLGLAGLAKYTAVLFLVPIALYFLIRKRFDLFITPKMFPALLVALAIISPVLIWNVGHDWISFTYQSGHVVGSDTLDWRAFGQSVAAQFGAYSPFLFPVAFYGLFKALRSDNDLLFLSALFGTVLIGFFTYASLYKPALPHWSAPFYLLFIPIGSYYLWRTQGVWKKYLYVALSVSMLITLVAYAELAFKFIPTGDYNSIHRDIYGFDTVMKEANALIEHPEREAIAVTNWTLASRAIFYNSAYKSDVYLLDGRYDQFDLWQHGSPRGRDLLVVNTHFFRADVTASMQCDAVEKARTLDIVLNGTKVNTIDYVWCRNFQGLKE
jgi:4-amino-4-deoxy-L-arabinose transferase-like glycosyltransferase